MTNGAMGVLLGQDVDVEVQLRWALQLAAARSFDLQVFMRVESKDDRIVEVALGEPAAGPTTVVTGVLEKLVESNGNVCLGPRGAEGEDGNGEDQHVVCVRLKKVLCERPVSLRKLMVSELGRAKIKLFTVARADITESDIDLAKERQLFLRYVPCEVVYCFGLRDTVDLARIMVGVASGPHGDAAMRLGRDLAAGGGSGSLTAVRVNPSIGPDAEDVGEIRLEKRLKKALGSDRQGVRHRIVVDDQVHMGIRRVWDEGRHDLVLMGASRAGLQGGQMATGIPARVFKGEPRPILAVVSAESPIRNRAVGFLEGSIERLVPQIDRESRIALVDRIQSSSRWDFDFFVLMALSTTIAAVGLIQNSAAVVIGAMLVAPLMTPLLGLGLALVQGNPVLARISARAVVLGLGVALAVGFLVGLLTPGFDEPTREMLGRGGPGGLDLIVAFASGLAAAYASARPGLLAALPGVAIAAALVPPVATSGLALSIGNLDLAVNALLLFVINMVIIVLASMVSLWAVGLRNIKRVSRWRMVVVSLVVVSTAVLGVSMSLKDDAGPVAVALPPDLEASIVGVLPDHYRLKSMAVAYDEIGVQLNIRVAGDDLVPQDLAGRIRTVVRDHFQEPVRVRLLTQIDADPELQ